MPAIRVPANGVPTLTLGRWVRATVFGWILGIPCVIVLALLGEAMHVGGSQALVGLGMGAGIGSQQGRAIRPLLGGSAAWQVACLAGLGLPFLVTDLARLAGHPLPYSLPVAMTIGGLLCGLAQARLMRHVMSRDGQAIVWIVASVAGWSAAGLLAMLGESGVLRSVKGLTGAFVYLGTVSGGGIALGVATGVALVWLQRQTAAKLQDSKPQNPPITKLTTPSGSSS